MGRKKADIDWDKVRIKMEAGSSGTEIAGSLGIHSETFYRRFKQKYKVGFDGMAHSRREAGYCNLRTVQYVSALSRNTRMMDKLGDVWLGQGKASEDNGDQTRILISIAERMDAFSEKLKELESSIHSGAVSESALPAESSVSYQGCSGEEDQVRDELGAENPMGGET